MRGIKSLHIKSFFLRQVLLHYLVNIFPHGWQLRHLYQHGNSFGEDKGIPHNGEFENFISIHKWFIHGDLQYSCDKCDYKATKTFLLTHHKKSKHEGIRYGCNQCDYKATPKSSLPLHKKTKHEGIIYGWDECHYKATQTSQLKHEGIRYVCDRCDVIVLHKDYLARHKESKHAGVQYACDQCDYKASRTDHLIHHRRSKHEGMKYSCDQCDYNINQKTRVIHHKKTKHEGIKYNCDHCDYKTNWFIMIHFHASQIRGFSLMVHFNPFIWLLWKFKSRLNSWIMFPLLIPFFLPYAYCIIAKYRGPFFLIWQYGDTISHYCINIVLHFCIQYLLLE